MSPFNIYLHILMGVFNWILFAILLVFTQADHMRSRAAKQRRALKRQLRRGRHGPQFNNGQGHIHPGQGHIHPGQGHIHPGQGLNQQGLNGQRFPHPGQNGQGFPHPGQNFSSNFGQRNLVQNPAHPQGSFNGTRQ